jgi:hypothetical protein
MKLEKGSSFKVANTPNIVYGGISPTFVSWLKMGLTYSFVFQLIVTACKQLNIFRSTLLGRRIV